MIFTLILKIDFNSLHLTIINQTYYDETKTYFINFNGIWLESCSSANNPSV